MEQIMIGEPRLLWRDVAAHDEFPPGFETRERVHDGWEIEITCLPGTWKWIEHIDKGPLHPPEYVAMCAAHEIACEMHMQITTNDEGEIILEPINRGTRT